ncbi:hypothetical protein JK358_27135 [Nocardia sp. 2]|uniref:Clp R domain-containing protein n=1 Tax=Nocardia acididurans TaxID=2802282 RepID=A0ABS1MDD3_9NOCA|nr:hypothetical protein [Nocardia acididurans]
MFERFTDRARRTIVLAQEEARALDHDYIGTEHLLLALLAEQEGPVAATFAELGLDRRTVREQIQAVIGRGTATPGSHIPFTPRSKKVLELSLREALTLGNNHIGTEHLLLAVVDESEGVAAQVLAKLGADRTRVHEQLFQLLGRRPGPGDYVGGTISEVRDRIAALESRVARIEHLLFRPGQDTGDSTGTP